MQPETARSFHSMDGQPGIAHGPPVASTHRQRLETNGAYFSVCSFWGRGGGGGAKGPHLGFFVFSLFLAVGGAGGNVCLSAFYLFFLWGEGEENRSFFLFVWFLSFVLLQGGGWGRKKSPDISLSLSLSLSVFSLCSAGAGGGGGDKGSLYMSLVFQLFVSPFAFCEGGGRKGPYICASLKKRNKNNMYIFVFSVVGVGERVL